MSDLSVHCKPHVVTERTVVLMEDISVEKENRPWVGAKMAAFWLASKGHEGWSHAASSGQPYVALVKASRDGIL